MCLANRPPSQLNMWCFNAELLTPQRHYLQSATLSRTRRRCPRCQQRSAASPAAAKGFAATLPAAPEAAGVPADRRSPHTCTQPANSLSGISPSRQQCRCLLLRSFKCQSRHLPHVRCRRWCRCAAGTPGPQRQGGASELERDGTGLPRGLCLGGAWPAPQACNCGTGCHCCPGAPGCSMSNTPTPPRRHAE